MKGAIIGLLAVLLVLAIAFFQRNVIILMVCDESLNNISVHFKKEGHGAMLISNVRGDGAEIVSDSLPELVRKDFDFLYNAITVFTGSNNRIYVRYEPVDIAGDNASIEVYSRIKFHDSGLYLGDVHLEYRIENE